MMGRMETPESLRLSIAAGNFSPSLRHLVDIRNDEEAQEMKLLAVAGPARIDDLIEVAEARAEDFHRRWAESPARPPRMSPRAAGIRSVIEDVACGRLT